MKRKLSAFLSLLCIIVSCSLDLPEEEISAGTLCLDVRSDETKVGEKSFKKGDSLGLFLVDGGGINYDGKDLNNICFTYDGSRWVSDTEIELSGTDGTVYAYFPYSSEVTDITSIPVTSSDFIDWLYAEPVSGVDEGNCNVTLTMKHALGCIRLVFERGDYVGEGLVTQVRACATTGNFFTSAYYNFFDSCVLDASSGSLSEFSSTTCLLDYDIPFTVGDSFVLDLPFIHTAKRTGKIQLLFVIDGKTLSESFTYGRYLDSDVLICRDIILRNDYPVSVVPEVKNSTILSSKTCLQAYVEMASGSDVDVDVSDVSFEVVEGSDLAYIDDDGYLVRNGYAYGDVTVRATYDGISGENTFTFSDVFRELYLTESPVELGVGESLLLTDYLTVLEHDLTSGSPVSSVVSMPLNYLRGSLQDEGIVELNSFLPRVTGLKSGETVFEAYFFNAIYYQDTLFVDIPILVQGTYTKLVIEPDIDELLIGVPKQLTAYLVGYKDGVESSRTDVTSQTVWSSSDACVSVTSSGLATGMTAGGKSTISAVYGDYSAALSVPVNEYTYRYIPDPEYVICYTDFLDTYTVSFYREKYKNGVYSSRTKLTLANPTITYWDTSGQDWLQISASQAKAVATYDLASHTITTKGAGSVMFEIYAPYCSIYGDTDLYFNIYVNVESAY